MKLATFEVSTAVGPVRRLAVVEGGGDGSDGVSGDGDDVAYLDVTAGYARLLDDGGEPRPTEVAETLAPASMTEFLRGGDRCLDAAWAVPDAADAFDPTDATAEVRVNGEKWASRNVGDTYRSFGDLLAHASTDEGVLPGDVLGSGTIAGRCGFDLDRWIDYGDTVELSVEGLGTLSHRIVEQSG